MKRLKKKVSQSRELFVYKREITLEAWLKEQMIICQTDVLQCTELLQ